MTEMKYDDTMIEKNWLTIVKSNNIWQYPFIEIFN